jgi:hypothetical protein
MFHGGGESSLHGRSAAVRITSVDVLMRAKQGRGCTGAGEGGGAGRRQVLRFDPTSPKAMVGVVVKTVRPPKSHRPRPPCRPRALTQVTAPPAPLPPPLPLFAALKCFSEDLWVLVGSGTCAVVAVGKGRCSNQRPPTWVFRPSAGSRPRPRAPPATGPHPPPASLSIRYASLLHVQCRCRMQPGQPATGPPGVGGGLGLAPPDTEMAARARRSKLMFLASML